MSDRSARRHPPAQVKSFDQEAPLCVHPNTLFALGGAVEMDGTIGWTRSDGTGWLPFHCYVLCDRDDLVVIDTGLPLHVKAITSGLAALAASRASKTLLMTRREMDVLLNLPWIIDELDIDAVQYVGDLTPFDFFASFETAAAEAYFKATSNARVESVKPDTTQTIGSFQLTTMRGSIRTLATSWIFERSNGILFTSDCWGFLTAAHPAEPMIAGSADIDRVTVEDLVAHFNAKFDWLPGSDVDVLKTDIRRIFDDMQVEYLCPSYGKVIAGREAIRTLLEKTFEALTCLGRARPVSAMEGFQAALSRGSS